MYRHAKVLYHYIGFRMENTHDREDIFQETIVSIWLGLKRFQFQSSFQTWAIGITRRKIADHFRSAYKIKATALTGLDEHVSHTDETEATLAAMDLEKALKTLNGAEQELLFFIFTAQLTYPEISELTHIPVGTIKSKMAAIKNKLRKRLQEEG